jgi:(R,R)-butanediol dehydrogenase/meso-butanediol dehydrogenase/diacetyl reductase
VGLTTIAWARALGAGRVTAVDPVQSRRQAAKSFGATDVLTALADAEHGGYDVIAECAGRPDLLNGCVMAARPAFASGRIRPAPLVSRRLGLSDLNGAFEELARTSVGAKTLIQPC